MGLSDRRPPLPAPTETSADYGNITSDDLATDVSRRTDQTSVSIPEDGSPVTITTKHKSRGDGSANSNHSQTSLLIEYFEAGKSGGPGQDKRRPSVRVRVTPSRSRAREGSDHIEITETGKARKPSYTRRISLGSKKEENIPLVLGTDSLSSGSNLTGPPVEIEVLHNSSELSTSDVTGYGPYAQRSLVPASDVSSMPPDSMLQGEPRILSPPKRSFEHEQAHSPTQPADPPRSPLIPETSHTKEREITHRVMERIAQRDAGGDKLSHSGRRTSSREYIIDDTASRKRASSDSRRTDESSARPESSVNPSDISRRSERSGRSGTSNVSINNPKLLQTVEDAIKRLILPELNAVKEEQRIQRNRSKFDKTPVDLTTSLTTGDSRERRMSKSSSAPDVKAAKQPTVVVSRDGDELSQPKVYSSKERRSSRGSATSERSRKTSAETVVRDDGKVYRKRSKEHNRAKDAAIVLGTGALTAAALRHHDSFSSAGATEDKERRHRRKGSQSRSRTESHSEMTEEYSANSESIPPMPMMQSEIPSDLTRDSILSAETEQFSSLSSRDVATPTREFEVQQVVRGSPHQSVPGDSPTPTRAAPAAPGATLAQLGASHKNVSGTNIALTREYSSENHTAVGRAGLGAAAAGLGRAAVFSSQHDVSGLRESMSANTLDNYAPQRPLSPIQSVSSYRDSTIGPAETLRHSRVQSIRSEASLKSPGKSRTSTRPHSTRSEESFDSTQSAEFIHSKNRPVGFSFEDGYEIVAQDYEPESPVGQQPQPQTPRAADVDDWFDRGHEENERYRHEVDGQSSRHGRDEDAGESTSIAEAADPAYTEKVTAGKGLRSVGNTPEYVRTPVAVESAVASLLDPSMLSVPSSQGSVQKRPVGSSKPGRDVSQSHSSEFEYDSTSSKERWGAFKDQAAATQKVHQRQASRSSLPQSPARSMQSAQSQEQPKMMASALPVPGQDMPVIGHGLDDEEIDTNPSIIKGPMAGIHQGDRSHWSYEMTSPIPGPGFDRAAADAALGAAVGLGLAGQVRELDHNTKYKKATVQDEYSRAEDKFNADGSVYVPPNVGDASPGGLKDEGYMSSAQREGYTPDPYADNPLRSKRQAKHLSGMSHGMDPIYDAATGKGIDRIHSKDIVALMDHLTVRDAQRNARDTEILVTLVRSAAEMRNSFEDMKRFIEAQDRMIMQNSDRDADMVVQKVLGGPRPQPTGSPRTRRAGSSDDVGKDAQTGRRSVFRRALKGLSMKSTNDLSRIEDMLMTLLNEVEGLKEGQARQTGSLTSNEFLRQQQDPGYEPEGQAGTSSTPNQSVFFSTPSSRQLSGTQPMHSGGRRGERNRISTVIEGDEDEHDWNGCQNGERMTTPTQEARRASSLPSETPSQQQANFRASQGTEESSPKMTRSSKHRSTTSWGFGNFANKVSRWSKTTTSTDGQSYRLSTNEPRRPSSEGSRSGSRVNVAQEYEEQYVTTGEEHTEQVAAGAEHPRALSPLIPEDAELIDEARYQAHRNSLNLQHPQPRQGPTHRHQSHLESQAQTYYDSLPPDEMDQWGSSPSLALNRNINRRSTSTADRLSPIHSDNASVHSASEQAMRQQQQQQQNPPPRPPKIKDDGPLIPADTAPPNQQYYSSAGTYRASSLEPIQEARYSLETERDRSGRGLTPSPNLGPATPAIQRRITGPRPMGSRAASGASAGVGAGAAGPGSPAGSQKESRDGGVRRKAVSLKSAASDGTLLSYRSSLDEDNEMF